MHEELSETAVAVATNYNQIATLFQAPLNVISVTDVVAVVNELTVLAAVSPCIHAMDTLREWPRDPMS